MPGDTSAQLSLTFEYGPPDLPKVDALKYFIIFVQILNMSEQALKDINLLPELGSEKKHGNLCKGSFPKAPDENSKKNLEDGIGTIPANLVSTTTDDGETNGVPDVAVSEVEYIESENLDDLLSVDSNISVSN